MTVCNRCGKCCRIVAIRITNPGGTGVVEDSDFGDWISARGLVYTEDGWLLIPSTCLRLVEVPQSDGSSIYECTVHHNKPLYCQRYPVPGDWKPFGCAFDTG